MVLVLVGFNYRKAPLDLLARLSEGSTKGAQTISRELVKNSEITGAITLNTCNRLEIYLQAQDVDQAYSITINALARRAKVPPESLATTVELHSGNSVVENLFRVASGLNSMVIGESEISGQVSRSLVEARRDKTTQPTLERLFQTAAMVSKRISGLSGHDRANRTVLWAALDIAIARNLRLAHANTIVVGTGAYARVVVSAFKDAGVGSIGIYSSTGRASEFATTHNISAIADDELSAYIARADLIVTCSGNKSHVLTASVLTQARAGNGSMLTILDLALQSDVSDDAKTLPFIDLISLRDIRGGDDYEGALDNSEVDEIIKTHTDDFQRRERERSVVPEIIALRDHVALTIENEVERVRNSSGDEAAEQVADSLRRFSSKLLHKPLTRARASASLNGEMLPEEAIRLLFGAPSDLQ